MESSATTSQRYSQTMNPNLVPTLIVNKNGVTTTVHKKPLNTSAASTNLPAPAAPATDYLKERRINSLVTKLDTHLLLSPGQTFKLKNALAAYKDSTTYDLLEAAAQWNSKRLFPDGNFMYATITQNTEQAVREAAYYRTRFDTEISNSKVNHLINGMHLLDRYKDTALEQLTGTDQEIATALLEVTKALNEHAKDAVTHVFRNDDPATVIHDPDLIDLITTQYHRSHQIISYIEERRSADPAALREYLDNNTALDNGVL